MRRMLVAVAMSVLVYAGDPAVSSAAADKSVCESYCMAAAAGCYVAVAYFVGKDKCDKLYEGCVDGCYAALEVES